MVTYVAEMPYVGQQDRRSPDRTAFQPPAWQAKQYARYDNSPIYFVPSIPTTPASLNDATTDETSFRSRSSSISSHTKPIDNLSPAGPDPQSPKSTFFPNYSQNDMSATNLPIRKSSRNPPKLNLTPKSDRNFSDRNFTDPFQTSPTPSPWLGRHTPSGSPLLLSHRPSIPPSPLATTAPRTLSTSNGSNYDPTASFSRGSEPYVPASMAWNRARGMTVSASSPISPVPRIKASTSIPDMKGAGSGQRSTGSSAYKPDRRPNSRDPSQATRREPPMPWVDSAEGRGSIRSVRSAWTNASAMTYESSMFNDVSEMGTARSSFTGSFEMVTRLSTTGLPTESAPAPAPPLPEMPSRIPMTVEDTIDLYAEFEIDADLERRIDDGILQIETYIRSRSNTMQPQDNPPELDLEPLPPINPAFRPPQLMTTETPPKPPSSNQDTLASASSDKASDVATRDEISQVSTLLEPPNFSEEEPESQVSTPDPFNALRSHPLDLESPPAREFIEKFEPAPRDIYGFKKISQYISLEEYDTWNAEYVTYLDRRRRKWEVIMKQYGLETVNPVRFPPKSDKVKRYIRKGIPPEWRGAAWFWYAGGPDKLAREQGLYRKLVGRAQNGELSETDRDSIERDLHRTFPDNIKFKPDPEPQHSQFPGKAIGPNRTNSNRGPREPKVLGALRRVLVAFAIHNPNIGYCQSLNFLAGLLLLFLDEDEEKAFILLNILTDTHLPGIHAKLLEANVDVGVLMGCIQESMPAIWTKIDDVEEQQPTRGRGRNLSAPVGLRLPTVSLATTSWFMSCFLGNMPVESVLRVWDSLFYEGSKTLFRVSLAIFKTSEAEIRGTKEQLEIFQVVQGLPRRLLDINALMEACFKKRNGFGHLSQETIDARRKERRQLVRRDRDEKDWERTQQLQEQQARNPLGPGDAETQKLGRQRGRSILARKPLPGERAEGGGRPRIPPPPSMMLGAVQPSSNPINLPLSPARDAYPPQPITPPSQDLLPPPKMLFMNPMVLPLTPTDEMAPRPGAEERSRFDPDREFSGPTAPLRRAASKAKALTERSRSRKRERRKNWTDAEWMEAN